jgi:hypothetical protein
MGALSGISAGLLLVACVPLFTAGLFQSLNLTFRFDTALPAGEATLVHTAVFPEQVKLKKNFVQVAGRFQSDDELPGSVTVKAEVADLESGKVSQRISIKLNVGDDGSFRGSTKIKKNVGAGEMMSVTLEPSGGDLAQGTEVTVCVDLAKNKKALSSLPQCVSGDGDSGGNDGGGAAGESFASLQSDFFTPTCALGGCHSQASASAGLVLTADQSFDNLVNAPSTQSNINRVTPGDPENSYLVRKLRGDAGISGSRMPAGGPFLSDAQIQRFVDWIDAGAQNN